jgi:hypothetical protein
MHSTPAALPAACHNLLTRDEVAAILRVTPRAVNKFAAQGILPQVRLPGRRNALGYLDRDVHALITTRSAACELRRGPAPTP